MILGKYLNISSSIIYSMFLICRKMGGSPLQVSAWAPCEEFVVSYLKYNVGERDIENFQVLKTEEVDINQFLEKIPLSKGSAEAETPK
jgi:hypothetical protein